MNLKFIEKQQKRLNSICCFPVMIIIQLDVEKWPIAGHIKGDKFTSNKAQVSVNLKTNSLKSKIQFTSEKTTSFSRQFQLNPSSEFLCLYSDYFPVSF